MDLPSKDKPYESWRTVRDDIAIRDCVLGVLNTLLAPSDPTNIAAEDGTNYEVQLKAWINANGIADAKFQFV
jgi:hypothetical protein